MRTKTPKGVARLLIRAVENVYVEDAVEEKLDDLVDLFENAEMVIECTAAEQDEAVGYHRSDRSEDAEWYEELVEKISDRVEEIRDARKEKEKLEKFKGFAYVVGL
jgi:hypothetical protein